MRCPACEGELARTRFGAVAVDGCARCGGIWFDHGELTAIANSHDADLRSLDALFTAQAESGEGQSPRVCPRCAVSLFGFEFDHTPGIRFEACPECRGIWADHSDLRTLADRLLASRRPEAGAATATEDHPVQRKARAAASTLATVECPACRQSNARGAATCWSCGAPLTAHARTVCPRCEIGMKRDRFGGVSIDICSSCSGVWLDQGELAAVLRHPTSELRALEDSTVPEGPKSCSLWDAESPLLCPACSVEMVAKSYAYSSGVELEVCETCRGVWVDHGKLAAVSRYIADQMPYRGLDA